MPICAQSQLRMTRCRYDILYKQKVGAEDVFLGISGKTPGTADCEEMVVKVCLPGDALKGIELDVTADKVVVSSSNQYVRSQSWSYCSAVLISPLFRNIHHAFAAAYCACFSR